MKFKRGDKVVYANGKGGIRGVIIKPNTRFYVDTVYLVECGPDIRSLNAAWMDLIIEPNDILKGLL